jgi:predicted PhzF superfamily epimerase YddE/YHI9
MAGIPITVVDAFTDEPFRGNPAAVCLLDAWPGDEWLAAVAREMNLAETAFLVPRDDGDHDLRWFTPAVEVDLCGHATLASAFFLGGDRRFHTRSGVLTCRPENGWIELDFPALVPFPHDQPPAPLADALGVTPVGVWKSRFDLLVELADAAAVRALRPDPRALAAIETRGVIVTAAGGDAERADGIDFVSRFFAPGAGIDEDPVTGSAHCVLAPFWANRFGRAALVGAQESPRRGVVRVRVDGDRVKLGGQAVLVWRGELVVPVG